MIRDKPSLSMWVCRWALCNPIRRFTRLLKDKDSKASCGVAEGWAHETGRFAFFKSCVFLTANFTRLPLRTKLGNMSTGSALWFKTNRAAGVWEEAQTFQMPNTLRDAIIPGPTLREGDGKIGFGPVVVCWTTAWMSYVCV